MGSAASAAGNAAVTGGAASGRTWNPSPNSAVGSSGAATDSANRAAAADRTAMSDAVSGGREG